MLPASPMLATFDREQRALVPTDRVPDRGWLHVSAPGEAELLLLREAGVPAGFLRHALDPDEVARVDVHERGARLIVLRVPQFRGVTHDVPYRATTLAFVFLGDRIISVARHQTDLLETLLSSDAPLNGEPLQLLLRVVIRAAERFLEHLREIDAAVDRLEDRLQASQRNREVLELLKYQKALVHFTTALGSDQIMLEHLERGGHFTLTPPELDLLEDARVELRQAVEMTTVSGNILGTMMDAFASIISNNLNIVMKVLTALTIIITFPMLVATFFGMNVRLPGSDHPWAFLAICLGSAALAGGVTAVFWRQRWL